MKVEQIDKVLQECSGTPEAIAEAVNKLLAEDTEIKVGDTVAVVDEDLAIGGFVGKARVTGFSENKQWAELELPNGSKSRVQTTLLYRVQS